MRKGLLARSTGQEGASLVVRECSIQGLGRNTIFLVTLPLSSQKALENALWLIM
jgi:hypothetical protein